MPAPEIKPKAAPAVAEAKAEPVICLTVIPSGAPHWRAGMFFDSRQVFAPGALKVEQLELIRADAGLIVAEVPLAELPAGTVVIGLKEAVNGLIPGEAKKPAVMAQKPAPPVSGGYKPAV